MPPGTADTIAVSAPADCAHCTLPVPEALRTEEDERQFCCAGCRAAWFLIHETGLDGYYDFPERRDRAVESSGRGYAEFDHPAFHALHVRPARGGLLETDLYLEGVHCASCVWLVERVPLAVPGAIQAELDVGRAVVHLRWDPARATLSAIARFLDRIGYRPHPFRNSEAERLRRAEDRAMLARIGVAGAIAGNVMLLAVALYAGWFGAMEPAFTGYFRWVSFALTVPAILGPGRVFFASALGALRAGRLHMDVPIALALAAGFGRGTMNTISGNGPIYFDGVATLIFLLLVGRYLQQRAQRTAASSAELLYGLTPRTARLLEGDTTREVPTEALLPGMLVEVRAGDTVPADGTVVAGTSALDVALLTGESRPVAIGPGQEVFAGTVNRSGPLTMRVTRAGEASRVGRILADLEAHARRRAPIVHLADRLAVVFVAAVLVLATATLLFWLGRGSPAALDHAIALLIVTCPCALALATPLSLTAAIGRAARQGILIRGGDALEALARPGRLVLDKTGTLTEGRLGLLYWDGDEEARAGILGLERHANHPIGEAFRTAWPGVTPAVATGIEQSLGAGLSGMVGSRRLIVGSPGFVLARAADPEHRAGRIPAALTPVLLAADGRVIAAAGLGDPVRPDSASALDRLRRHGWRVEILSGDAPGVVTQVARKLLIPDAAAHAGSSPEQKLARVEWWLEEGPVVMVGDGVNDAAAIARATVGIGVHGGAEASLAAADVYLARPGLTPLADLCDGAVRTLAVIRRTIGWSLVYNVAGAGLAMAGLLNPLIAALLMPASSLTVVLVAWRSRTFGAAP
jgi:Cu2+-exporting ATPase